EGINDESFQLLDKETVRALIPKTGPRLIFMQKYSHYLADINQGYITNVSETVSTASTDTFDNASVYTYVPDEEIMNAIFSTPLKDVGNLSNGKRRFDEISVNVEQAGPSKKAKIENDVFPRGLEFALNKYPDGKIVLSAKNKLTNELRNKLTKVIITELYALYGINNIKADIFKKVSNEIEVLFPSEKHETYYVPYNSVNKSGPRGKLYTKFINTKTSLRLADASSSRNSLPIDEENIGEDKSDLESGLLSFLRVGIEPLTRIEADFNKKHEGCIDIIYNTWEKVSFAIIAEAKERKINSIASEKDVLGPSRSEVQESFFSHVQNIAELHERIEARNEKLKKFGLTVQPFAVIVGDLSHPTYIIVVDEVQYKVDTGIRALELLFKLFHGLDIEYPPESEHIWLFIEELVFKLKPRKTSPSTSTVLADILYHMQK
ncbi:hypothetical protein NQ314_012063, partial [Rhamnusium bicolor]